MQPLFLLCRFAPNRRPAPHGKTFQMLLTRSARAVRPSPLLVMAEFYVASLQTADRISSGRNFSAPVASGYKECSHSSYLTDAATHRHVAQSRTHSGTPKCAASFYVASLQTADEHSSAEIQALLLLAA